MLTRCKKWSSWWNGAVITDICGLKLNEICHHQMRFMGSSTSKIRLRPRLRPGPRWGSLQRSPRPSSWWGGGSLHPPQELHPRSRPFGPRASAFRASSLTPKSKNQTSPMGGGKSAGPIKIRLLRPWRHNFNLGVMTHDVIWRRKVMPSRSAHAEPAGRPQHPPVQMPPSISVYSSWYIVHSCLFILTENSVTACYAISGTV